MRFEGRPVNSRVGAFPDVSSPTNSRFKGTESRGEPRVRFRLATGEFGNYWCKWKRQWYYKQSGESQVSLEDWL